MTAIEIEKLAAWSPAKEVQTRQGRRLLRKAAPTDAFSAAWRSNKDGCKAAGLSWSKDERSGTWEACWWMPVSEAQAAAENAAIAASRATDADVDIPCPDGLAYMPFQRAGVAYMLSRSATLLADQMGLGKTVQAVGVVNADKSIRRVLVVCPASLKVNWRNELARWLVRPLRVGVQVAGEPWCGGEVDVVVINYDILSKFPKIYAEEWDMLVADEAHFLKSRTAKRTKLLLGVKPWSEYWETRLKNAIKSGVRSEVKRLQDKKDEAARYPGVKAKRKVLMTGTPVLNKPSELFTLLDALQPGVWTFKDKVRYCAATQGSHGWDFSGAAHLDELQNRLRSSVMVRRLKSEVLTELPPKRRQIVELPTNGDAGLVEEEREQFERHESGLTRLKALAEAAALGDDEAAYAAAADELKRAYRVAFEEIAKVRHQVALAKVPKVVEHVTDMLEESGKIVLFTHHHDVTDQIAGALADYQPMVVDGRTLNEDRQGIVDTFNAVPEKRVLLLGIKAAGVGLSVKASVEVFAELDWTPGVVSQAEDRCHGIGRGIEGEPLLVQHLVLEGSLDARMVRTIVQKQDVADRALDKGAGLVAGAVPVLTVEVGSVLEGGINPQDGGKDAPKATPGPIASVLGAGLRVSEELRAHVHAGLRTIAGSDCDFARELNGVGFNKLDCAFGHCLAERDRLTDRMVAAGVRLVTKYKRQLGEGYSERLADLRKQ